jgi:hypothetical protein
MKGKIRYGCMLRIVLLKWQVRVSRKRATGLDSAVLVAFTNFVLC